MNYYKRIQRIAKSIVAALEQTIEYLKQNYPGMEDTVNWLIDNEMPEQSLQWAMQNIKENPRLSWGRRDDIYRLKNAFEFFRENKAQNWFKELASQVGFQGKNILDYPLRAIEEIKAIKDRREREKSKRKLEKEAKQKGARKVYDEGGIQVIKIGGPETDLEQAAYASCYYARGTKWCTSDAETAKQYLEHAPLYVIMEHGEKVAQYYVDSEGNWELFDPQDEELKDPTIVDKVNRVLFQVVPNYVPSPYTLENWRYVEQLYESDMESYLDYTIDFLRDELIKEYEEEWRDAHEEEFYRQWMDDKRKELALEEYDRVKEEAEAEGEQLSADEIWKIVSEEVENIMVVRREQYSVSAMQDFELLVRDHYDDFEMEAKEEVDGQYGDLVEDYVSENDIEEFFEEVIEQGLVG